MNTKEATFTHNSITIKGKTFPAEYSLNPSGALFAFVTVQEGGEAVKLRIKIDPQDVNYAQAVEAAKQEHASRKKAKAEPVAEPVAVYEYYTLRRPPMPGGIPNGADSVAELPEPLRIPGSGTAYGIARYTRELSAKEIADHELVPMTEPVAEPVVEPVAVAEPVPVAESVAVAEPVAVSGKPFIGTEIAGNGWKIRFDPACGRTRVILQSEPSPALREAIEKAGFYWSGVMKSWNKKLTVKAYKAAQALALDLRKLCA